jgi:hypothetical protein
MSMQGCDLAEKEVEQKMQAYAQSLSKCCEEPTPCHPVDINVSKQVKNVMKECDTQVLAIKWNMPMVMPSVRMS